VGAGQLPAGPQAMLACFDLAMQSLECMAPLMYINIRKMSKIIYDKTLHWKQHACLAYVVCFIVYIQPVGMIPTSSTAPRSALHTSASIPPQVPPLRVRVDAP
jgi:hypothetical protein